MRGERERKVGEKGEVERKRKKETEEGGEGEEGKGGREGGVFLEFLMVVLCCVYYLGCLGLSQRPSLCIPS